MATKARTKECARCHRRRRLVSFGKNKNQKDGLQRWCKDCTAEYARERQKDKAARGRAVEKVDGKMDWLLTGLLNGYLSPGEARRLKE